MANKLVVIDMKLDRLLQESPELAIRLITQEYQIAYDKTVFITALAAKLVVLKNSGGSHD
ncbi:hypothetical protein [Herbaspirillum autotrophicum]|uniref:hypothetical protein n=1 Tax=Herbaspirillum autotrophicum TaxID=180195 RepID=UPI00067D064F|nr:hypothetical protein [Herbaspirillum autotrophicum]